MKINPMFGRKYYWGVTNAGGVFPDAIGMTRARAIRRYIDAYRLPWAEARAAGMRCIKITISTHQEKA